MASEESMNATKLGAEIRRLRQSKNGTGVSLRDVEKVTKINNAYLSLLENGEIANPSPHRLHKLAEFFEVPYEGLMIIAGYMKESSGQEPQRDRVRMSPHAEQYFRQANLTDAEWQKVVSFVADYMKPPRTPHRRTRSK